MKDGIFSKYTKHDVEPLYEVSFSKYLKETKSLNP